MFKIIFLNFIFIFSLAHISHADSEILLSTYESDLIKISDQVVTNDYTLKTIEYDIMNNEYFVLVLDNDGNELLLVFSNEIELMYVSR